jgi:signal transduction histidine kinase
MGRPLRALLVEDNERDAAIVVRELKRGGYELTHERVETASAMTDALARQAWDIVLSDYSMPQFSALAAVSLVAEAGLDLPFIVISGAVGEEAAVEVMRAGAHDFLLKHKLTRLVPAIERELKQAERRAQHKVVQGRLRQMEKMDALGQLTGGIAHDFNNILAVIIGMAELTAASVSDRPKVAAMVKQIDEAAERGARLVQRLLSFARKQPQEKRVLDLNDTVKRAADMLRHTLGEHINLETVLAPEPWHSLADPFQLEAAIVNLSTNARDAMPNGGRLLIETANVHLDEHYAAQNADASPGDHVAVIVTDSGTGIPREIVERVFEPFFTTKEVGRGTGLGLSMVYGFAKQSGGHVKIYSEVGHGTSVRLYLPKVAEQAASAAEALAGPSDTKPAAAGTILVVEDDPAVRKMAVNVLEDLGYQVRQAPDGRSALDFLQGTTSHIDLLFTDMVMPNEVSGQDLIRAARKLRPDLKFLLTSGYSEHFIKGQQDPDVRLLNKPYRREMLATAVRKALDNEPTSQRAGAPT